MIRNYESWCCCERTTFLHFTDALIIVIFFLNSQFIASIQLLFGFKLLKGIESTNQAFKNREKELVSLYFIETAIFRNLSSFSIIIVPYSAIIVINNEIKNCVNRIWIFIFLVELLSECS